jgi:hypothetical protein
MPKTRTHWDAVGLVTYGGLLGMLLAMMEQFCRFCRKSGSEPSKDQVLLESSCGEQIELLRE